MTHVKHGAPFKPFYNKSLCHIVIALLIDSQSTGSFACHFFGQPVQWYQ